MIDRAETIDEQLHVRRCVCCGYDGALLRGGRAPHCARCGCDLNERPALSYAEMEGFVGAAVADDHETPHGPAPQMLQSWLTFLFFVVLGVLLVISLASAAMP